MAVDIKEMRDNGKGFKRLVTFQSSTALNK